MQPERNHRLAAHPQFNLSAPYSSVCTLELGVLSILFSFGRPVAFDYLDGPKMLAGLPRFSSKHVYNWRDFRKLESLSSRDFDSAFLDALASESTNLLRNIAMTPYEETDLEQTPSTDPEIEQLDHEIEDEDDFDLDDDFDDEDEDDDNEDDDDFDDDDDDLMYDDEPNKQDDDEGVVN